jgi:hypothetical protein
MGHRRDGASVPPLAAILLGVSETAVSIRRARGALVALTVALNAALFAVGVYFELHPRDRNDTWSAPGVAMVGLLNSAALTVPPSRAAGARFLGRLRRIVFLANSLLLLLAALVAGVEALADWRRAAVYAVVLALPPLLTIAALRRSPY